jgi:dienelactone hydrolase
LPDLMAGEFGGCLLLFFEVRGVCFRVIYIVYSLGFSFYMGWICAFVYVQLWFISPRKDTANRILLYQAITYHLSTPPWWTRSEHRRAGGPRSSKSQFGYSGYAHLYINSLHSAPPCKSEGYEIISVDKANPTQLVRVLLPFFIVNRTSAVQARLTKFITGIRTDPATSSLKIGVAGFCWGGKYAFLLAHNDGTSSSSSSSASHQQPLIDCAFAAHPSMLKVPEDVEPVRRPLSVAVGDTDMALSTPGIRSMETILTKKGGDHEVVILDGAKHGFAVRMHPDDELQNRYAVVAEEQAIAWFTRWLRA